MLSPFVFVIFKKHGNDVTSTRKLGNKNNDCKFSKSKPHCVYICQHDDPLLHVYESPIPVVGESKLWLSFLR